MLPSSTPKATRADVERRIRRFAADLEPYPFFLVGVRGYYRDSMGAPGANDRGIYDDAMFVMSPNVFAAFNANTDPSRFRPKTAKKKGMAVLRAGMCYLAHRFGAHKGYRAIVQWNGPVTVDRDGDTTPDVGYHGINIHRGGRTTTGSEGCQTIHPSQWDSFIALTQSESKRVYGAAWFTTTIPYVLLDGFTLPART